MTRKVLIGKVHTYTMTIRVMPLLLCASLAACGAATSTAHDNPTTLENVKLNNGDQSQDYTREVMIKPTAFAVDRAHLWHAMLAAHTAIGLKAMHADSIDGSATFEGAGVHKLLGKPTSYYVDCGRGAGNMARADYYSVTLRVDEKVISTDVSSSQLLTKITPTARDRTTSADVVQCTSTGALETAIAGVVMAQLK